MKKKATGGKSKTPGKLTAKDFGALIAEVRSLIQSARQAAATTVNTLQVLTNFEIGRRIVEHEQQGAERAGYGSLIIRTLSTQLTSEFGKGFSKANLEYMRRFYLVWKDRGSPIAQKPSGQLALEQKSQKPSDKSSSPPRAKPRRPNPGNARAAATLRRRKLKFPRSIAKTFRMLCRDEEESHRRQK
jgi:DUF1016 N-terminal domain